ncbi:hypothetical protein ABLA30_18330 [Xenorhabdus nematophila]|uniref:Uncharacterized protein n=1 Tax=Xenorhabdus poinarii G6 TaxID=1354304 RepID=A0A068R5I5_9GAMM|nr:hypothetical protein [Xenorhabdus poinarii]CDG22224.1 protein of unknown function [Xenorhabdus poinarii G6]
MQNFNKEKNIESIDSKKQTNKFSINVKKKSNQEERRALGALVK